jgi:hypothetical protein
MTIGFAAVRANGAVNAFDISGKWVFSVDLDDGGHGDPTFVYKQDQNKLTGSYDGPLWEIRRDWLHPKTKMRRLDLSLRMMARSTR